MAIVSRVDDFNGGAEDLVILVNELNNTVDTRISFGARRKTNSIISKCHGEVRDRIKSNYYLFVHIIRIRWRFPLIPILDA